MQYSQQVTELFQDESHVLDDEEGLDGAATGVAGSRDKRGWVGFVLRSDGPRIVSLRFQAFGCPELIAACAYVAVAFEGQDLSIIDTLNTSDLMSSLQIPTEKAGKMLLLQDALQNCRKALLSVG